MTTPSIWLVSWPERRTAPADRAAGLRLTARGRAVVAGLAVLTAVAAAAVLLLGAALAAPAGTEGRGVDGAVLVPAVPGAALAADGLAYPYVVQRGDTLWGIASTLDPAGDPRPLVDRIQQLNARADSRLAVGEVLWLPVGSGR